MTFDILAITHGPTIPHPVNRQWFSVIGTQKFVSFLGFNAPWVARLPTVLVQFLSLCSSIFLPRAKKYILSSTSCVPAVIINKHFFGSTVIAVNSDTFYRDILKAKGLKKKYMLWLVKHVDGLISSSSMVQELARKTTSVPNEIVNPGCNVEKFLKVKSNNKSDNVCAIGMGITTKGSDLLLEAFEEYNKVIPESKLFLCGETHWISHLPFPPNLVTPGMVDPAPFLEKSGIYVNASRHESFGVSILEALCAGVIPIVTDRCGAAEIVRKVSPSLVVRADAKEIAKRMLSLSSEGKKKFVKKGKELAKGHTVEKSKKEFKHAFEMIIKEVTI